jgi:arginyl-tRNA synthetase
MIERSLERFGVRFDTYFSERTLHERGEIDEVVRRLRDGGFAYDADGAVFFRSTAFGDEIDRPLKRSNGAWTYFAADLAYHADKIRRGFPLMIDAWGADHGGYVKRLQAAVTALSDGKARLDVRLCQLVNLLDEGRPLKMSKRAGRIVTLRDVVDEVGRDVVRFIMLTRKNDAPLDFDLAKVTEQSKDNPVFYVQYAHARICSVFRRAEEDGYGEAIRHLEGAAVERLSDPAELAVLRQLGSWPRTVEGAALAFEPHRIAFYLNELASAFHLLWTKGNEDQGLRFLQEQNLDLTRARLAMLAAVRLVIARGLELMGVQPLAELH